MISPLVCVEATAGLGRQDFEEMAVRVAEVKAAAAMAVVDFHVLGRARSTAIGETLAADAIKDPVAFRVAHLEGVVMPLEAVPVVEVDGQRVVDLHRGEVRDGAVVFETKNPGEESGGFLLVAGGDDRVVEYDAHRRLLVVCEKDESGARRWQARVCAPILRITHP